MKEVGYWPLPAAWHAVRSNKLSPGRALIGVLTSRKVLGACLINLDVALHILPSWRSFQIHKSTKFLAASLSLSFGVMVGGPSVKLQTLRAEANGRV